MKEEIRGGNLKNYVVECAWCGVEIEKSIVPDSHGICRSCFNKVLKEIRGTELKNIEVESKAAKSSFA
ncbi:MAG: hypothetical protein JNN15_10935 [Blastocatellia bacterium]|nr:hypothetical protein [Blastocatellia bacterium]